MTSQKASCITFPVVLNRRPWLKHGQERRGYQVAGLSERVQIVVNSYSALADTTVEGKLNALSRISEKFIFIIVGQV